MKIANKNNLVDVISLKHSKRNGRRFVMLGIGKGKRARHAHLLPAEARAVAYALLLLAEQLSVSAAQDSAVYSARSS